VYGRLLAAEPHATSERKRELMAEAASRARVSPLYFDLTVSFSKALFHASLGRTPGGRAWPAMPRGRRTGQAWSPRWRR
jgi:hypothetical protein